MAMDENDVEPGTSNEDGIFFHGRKFDCYQNWYRVYV
jgi:hypothetical protein